MPKAAFGVLQTLLATNRNGQDFTEFWQTENGSIVHLEGRTRPANLETMKYGPANNIGRPGLLVEEYTASRIKPLFPFGKEGDIYPSDDPEWHPVYYVDKSKWRNEPPLRRG